VAGFGALISCLKYFLLFPALKRFLKLVNILQKLRQKMTGSYFVNHSMQLIL